MEKLARVVQNNYIEFFIPKSGNVKVTLYNTMGQKIYNLTNQQFVAGNHKIEVDAMNLQSGTYIYHMIYNDFKQSHKIIVLK